MTDYSITKDDKLSLINSHMRSIEMNKYTSELIVLEQEALENADEVAVSRANEQIASANLQLVALQAQKEAVESE